MLQFGMSSVSPQIVALVLVTEKNTDWGLLYFIKVDDLAFTFGYHTINNLRVYFIGFPKYGSKQNTFLCITHFQCDHIGAFYS